VEPLSAFLRLSAKIPTMPPKKRRKQEEPWKQVKRHGRILIGQPPAARIHEDPRKKRPKHKKREEAFPDEQ
jgi:hypothetical protein